MNSSFASNARFGKCLIFYEILTSLWSTTLFNETLMWVSWLQRLICKKVLSKTNMSVEGEENFMWQFGRLQDIKYYFWLSFYGNHTCIALIAQQTIHFKSGCKFIGRNTFTLKVVYSQLGNQQFLLSTNCSKFRG